MSILLNGVSSNSDQKNNFSIRIISIFKFVLSKLDRLNVNDSIEPFISWTNLTSEKSSIYIFSESYHSKRLNPALRRITYRKNADLRWAGPEAFTSPSPTVTGSLGLLDGRVWTHSCVCGANSFRMLFFSCSFFRCTLRHGVVSDYGRTENVTSSGNLPQSFIDLARDMYKRWQASLAWWLLEKSNDSI